MIIFFDIETILDDPSDRIKEKYEDSYKFMPEATKIYTICLGYKTKDGEVRIGDFSFPDEKQIIEEFFKVIDKSNIKLVGFNINNFDIPFIVKRALHHGIKIPDTLKFYGKKPWELDHLIDLHLIYKMNVWNSKGDLDTVMHHLGLKSPKEEGVDGGMVQELVDQGRGDEVVEYCKRDVQATIDLYDKFLLLNFI